MSKAMKITLVGGIIAGIFVLGAAMLQPVTEDFLRSNSEPNLTHTSEDDNGASTLSTAELVVASTSGSGVPFMASEDASYRFEIRDGKYCTEPELCRSVIRGYLGREVEWQDWDGIPHPMNSDYQIGCWENDISANQTCGQGQSEIIQMKAGQQIVWIVVDDKDSYGGNVGDIVLSISPLK